MTFKKKYPLWLVIFGKHWFAAVLCFIMSTCLLVSFGTRLGRVITQFCSCAIYYAMLYSAVRDYGENDRNKVDIGQGKKDVLKGFKCGFLACLPNILASVALLILRIIGTEPGSFMVIYRMLVNPFYMPINLTLLQPSLSIIEIPVINVLISVMLSIIGPLVSGFSYIVGYGQSTVMELIMFKSNQDKSQKQS